MPTLAEIAASLAEQRRNAANAYDPSRYGNERAGMPDSPWQFDTNGELYFDSSRIKAPTLDAALYGISPTSGAETGSSYAEAQQQLARIRRFDPNATLGANQYGGGGEGGGGGFESYTLNFDQSKVPQPKIPGLRNFGGYGADRLRNPNAAIDDPNYGPMTSNANVVDYANAPGLADIIGPIVVAAATGIGAGGLSGLLGGASSANPIGAGVANALPGVARAAGNEDWLGALLSSLPVAGSAAGIPSYLTSGGTTLARILSGKRQRGG
jgi:hypothetical protein